MQQYFIKGQVENPVIKLTWFRESWFLLNETHMVQGEWNISSRRQMIFQVRECKVSS